MNFKNFTRTEFLGFIFLLLVYAIGIYFSNTDLEYFNTSYAQEDGFAEYGTAFILACISLFLITRLFRLWSIKPALWKIGVISMILLFLFGAGEEISWGQRIFNIESSEYFKQNNAQQETNLHNMIVGETKINKLVFSKILTVVLVIYLLILPFLYRSIVPIKKLVDAFAVPIPRLKHTLAFLLATGLIFLMPSEEKWELYELAFAVIFFLIYLNPFNRLIFQKK